ncbi:uncharacterized protein LOC141590699 [Silene latifolia]|uniref:uncharacterized protein LOC141590699 n=1 Tax=Silene latifolia TaxID=37657 RepID=UPI003D778132
MGRKYDIVKLASNPSVSWGGKSLLWGLELLRMSCAWKVCSSSTLNVWSSRWVEGRCPSPKHPELLANSPNLKDIQIKHLLRKTQLRNEDLVGNIFDMETTTIILGIHISPYQMEDYLFWNASSTGLYSVKKGYGIAHQQLWDLYASPKDRSRLGVLHAHFIKSRLWHLPGPKVWTILIWKILTDTLPIGIEFQKRELNHVCLRCCLGDSCEAVETMEHLFRDCDVAKRLWMGSHLGIRTDNVGSLDVKGWIINWLLYLLKQDDSNRGVLSFMCSLWTIWKVRSHNAFKEPTCSAVGAMRIYEMQFNLAMAAEKRLPDQKPPGFGAISSEDSLQDIGRRLKKGDELMLYGDISSCPKYFICVDAFYGAMK